MRRVRGFMVMEMALVRAYEMLCPSARKALAIKFVRSNERFDIG
jgi:hypothetical protein